jgi:hypothetical protein
VVQIELRALTAEAAEVLAAAGQPIGEPLPHGGFVRALGLSPGGMRHKSYTTTQVYINMARQIDEAVDVLHVPDVLKPRRAN